MCTRAMDVHIYTYIHNPLFNSLVWGSLTLAPIRVVHDYTALVPKYSEGLQGNVNITMLVEH